MFSLFLTNKDNKDLSSRFLNAHTSLENNEIKSINPRFKIASWGPQDSILIHKFDNILIAIDGYCFFGNTLVNPSFVYKQVKNRGLDVKSLNGSFNIVIYDLLSNKLQLFNDKFGTRALFYNEIPSGIIISSRLNIITKCFSKGLQINSNSLAKISNIKLKSLGSLILEDSIFLIKILVISRPKSADNKIDSISSRVSLSIFLLDREFIKLSESKEDVFFKP